MVVLTMPETDTKLIVRATGEVVNLTDPLECAMALQSIRDLEGELRIMKLRLSEAIAEEASRLGTKTLALDDHWKAVLSGGREVEWDGEKLRADLTSAGMPLDRIDQIVERRVTYKVSATEAKRAAAANADYAAVVADCQTWVETPVRVSVRRA